MNRSMVDALEAADVTIIPDDCQMSDDQKKFFSQRSYCEPPYYGPGSKYPVSDTDDPKVKSNVVGRHGKRALEIHTRAENEEYRVRRKSKPLAEDPFWGCLTLESVLKAGREWKKAHMIPVTEDQAGVQEPQKLKEGLLEKQQEIGRRSSSSMASSSGDENNKSMVNSAKPADVTIIPNDYRMDDNLKKFMSQRSYDEPTYIGLDNVESRPGAKDTMWGWLTHEYILGLAKTNKQANQTGVGESD